MKNIVILASGEGTNADCIAKKFKDNSNIRVAALFCNRAKAHVLNKMEILGIPTVVLNNEKWREGSEVVEKLNEYNPDLIVLAGFLAIISSPILDAFSNKIINLHPSLLPKFGGKGMYGDKVHEAVKAAGEKTTGITIHYVTREVDGGKIIAQFPFEIKESYTVEDIATKIHATEHAHYPEVIEKLLENNI